MAIPTQDNCDPNNPREAFLWMLVDLSNSKVPLIFPRPVMEDISERIYRAGGRYHPEHQQIFYKPPTGASAEDASLWDSLAGEWVVAEEEGLRPPELEQTQVQRMIDELDDAVLAELVQELGRRGFTWE